MSLIEASNESNQFKLIDKLPHNISYNSIDMPDADSLRIVIKIKNLIITGGEDKQLSIFSDNSGSFKLIQTVAVGKKVLCCLDYENSLFVGSTDG